MNFTPKQKLSYALMQLENFFEFTKDNEYARFFYTQMMPVKHEILRQLNTKYVGEEEF